MLRKSLFAGLCGVLVGAPVVMADTLPAVADTQINLTAVGAKGGALPTLAVKNAGAGADYRTFVRFDLSALPLGLPVQKATLRLWPNLVTTEGNVEIAAVLGPWDESSLAAVTAPDISATIRSFPVRKTMLKTWIHVDVTVLVQDWLLGVLPNYSAEAAGLANNGLALVGGVSDDVNVRFDSKESLQTSHPMELEVVLGLPNGTGDITAVLPHNTTTNPSYVGLVGGGNLGELRLGVDPLLIQRRVSGSCAVGSSIRAINLDGAVVCEADDAPVPPTLQVLAIAGGAQLLGTGLTYQWVGQTVFTGTLTGTHRVFGAAAVAMQLLSPSPEQLPLGLCYQSAGGAITSFAGVNTPTHNFSTQRASYPAAASGTLGAGNWKLGLCMVNRASATINAGDVSGWFLITN